MKFSGWSSKILLVKKLNPAGTISLTIALLICWINDFLKKNAKNVACIKNMLIFAAKSLREKALLCITYLKKSIELYFFAIKKSGDLRYQSKKKFNVHVLSVDLTWFLDCEVMPDFQDSGEQLSSTLFYYLKNKIEWHSKNGWSTRT